MNIARDIICTRGKDDKLYCTNFHVNFKPASNLYRWFSRSVTNASSATSAAPSPTTPSTPASPADVGGVGKGGANNFTSALLTSIGLGSSSSKSLSALTAASGATATALHSAKANKSSPSATKEVITTTSPSSTIAPISAAPAHDDAGIGSPVVAEGFASSSLSSPAIQSSTISTPSSSAPAAIIEGQLRTLPPHNKVDVRVNGQIIQGLEMIMDEKGFGVFKATGTTQPPVDILSTLPLQPGPNPIEFIYRSTFGDVSTKAKMHLWETHDKVVVTDIDGTITKSDVIGYIDTVQLGKYDYTHQGICRLYSHLNTDHQIRFVYLTSRPISLLDATRTYIEKCEQEGQRLPVGPIFTSTESLTRVLYKELIEKTVRFYKAHTLMDITTVFQRAGRDPEMPMFLFGFGNKVADGQAYSAAGLHPDNIFIINPYSDIRVFGHEADGLGAGRGPEGSPTRQQHASSSPLLPPLPNTGKKETITIKEGEAELEVDHTIAAVAVASAGNMEAVVVVSPTKEQPTKSPGKTTWRILSPSRHKTASIKSHTFMSYSDDKLLELLTKRLDEMNVGSQKQQEQSEDDEKVGVS